MNLQTGLLVLLLSWTISAARFDAASQDITLTFLHTNDIHGRIDEFAADGTPCTEELRRSNSCFGGTARLKTMVDKIRNINKDRTIFVDAGDYSVGTIWYYLNKANIVGDAMSYLRHDAMTLGNHEFDGGSVGLLPLLIRARDLSIPILACNLNFSQHSILYDYQPEPSIVIERSGVKIGIIGYLLQGTTSGSNTDNDTMITDEINCIQREAERLNRRGVKIIIALGHAGYERDKDIVEKIPLVKMIIGGHSHTYLSSGDTVRGDYPTVVTRAGGDRALIVQDYWLGKYLGYINVTFDQNTGRVLSWEGDRPLLLDHSIPKDDVVERFLRRTREDVEAQANAYIGTNLFKLDIANGVCRLAECALGNLLTDAFMDHFVVKDVSANNTRWRTIDIAVASAGQMRSWLPRGNVTFGDIVTFVPFTNPVWIVKMTGSDVAWMFETSVRRLDGLSGGFLQMSGARIVVDPKKPELDRIVSIEVLCANCTTPVWEPLNSTRSYRVAMSSFLARGKDQYDKLASIPASNIEKLRLTDVDFVKEYIQRYSPIHPTTEGRIRFLTEAGDPQRQSSSSTRSALLGGPMAVGLLLGAVFWHTRGASL